MYTIESRVFRPVLGILPWVHVDFWSSESALYCRVFTEGLFGILPTGLDRFRCTPRLPEGWPRMALRSIRAFGREWDLVVERREERLGIIVQQAGQRVFDRTVDRGATVEVVLP